MSATCAVACVASEVGPTYSPVSVLCPLRVEHFRSHACCGREDIVCLSLAQAKERRSASPSVVCVLVVLSACVCCTCAITDVLPPHNLLT